jgi:hypothetical protein
MSDTFKAAVVQAAPVPFDTPQTILKFIDQTRDAAGKNARLVVSNESTKLTEIDRWSIVRGEYDLDLVGHYVRPIVLNLTVDTRPRSAVQLLRRVSPMTC